MLFCLITCLTCFSCPSLVSYSVSSVTPFCLYPFFRAPPCFVSGHCIFFKPFGAGPAGCYALQHTLLMHGKAGTERLNTALSKHGVFSGCLGIWALRCVFNKKLHRTGFVPFPLLMSTRGILPEEGLLDKPYPAGMHSIWKSRK